MKQSNNKSTAEKVNAARSKRYASAGFKSTVKTLTEMINQYNINFRKGMISKKVIKELSRSFADRIDLSSGRSKESTATDRVEATIEEVSKIKKAKVLKN